LLAVPVAEPARKTGPVSDAASEEVLKVVERWTRAWSAQDVNAYLAFYADDFQPVKKQSREAWAKEREARIKAKASIAVKVESPAVSVNGDTATVKFKQVYQSDQLVNATRKTLVLAKQAGQWKIQQELSES
jgi:ketosteroid isomerase-like protein